MPEEDMPEEDMEASMKAMKCMPAVAAATALVFVFAGTPAWASDKAPVKLGQKVTIEGKTDVSSKPSATIEEEIDDKYFNPTFIKAAAGEKITFKVKNGGSLTHTFTSDTLSIDKQISPGKSVKFTVTVPSSGAVFQFHCQFHGSSGMVGAVYTKAGASASSSSTKSSSSSGSPGY